MSNVSDRPSWSKARPLPMSLRKVSLVTSLPTVALTKAPHTVRRVAVQAYWGEEGSRAHGCGLGAR